MPIRTRNLDLQSDGMKRHVQTNYDVISGVIEKIVFIAPVACTIDRIDTYSPVSQTSIAFTAYAGSASTALLGVVTTADFAAHERIRITPSANNSVSTGTPITIQYSASTAVPGSITCHVQYTPALHRESN